MGWMILVLITKGNTNTRSIGPLVSLWKVVKTIINTRLRKNVRLHNVLQGFRAGKETRKAILELKLVQELDSVDQGPPFLIFLYLRKAYETVDCGQLQKTLERYGADPHMFRLVVVFWDQQEVVTRQNGYHGLHFR